MGLLRVQMNAGYRLKRSRSIFMKDKVSKKIISKYLSLTCADGVVLLFILYVQQSGKSCKKYY